VGVTIVIGIVGNKCLTGEFDVKHPGFTSSPSLIHGFSLTVPDLATSRLTAKITPDAYSQVRRANGSSCLMSRVNAPIRAMISNTPTLKIICSESSGMISSQDAVGNTPKPIYLSWSV